MTHIKSLVLLMYDNEAVLGVAGGSYLHGSSELRVIIVGVCGTPHFRDKRRGDLQKNNFNINKFCLQKSPFNYNLRVRRVFHHALQAKYGLATIVYEKKKCVTLQSKQ